VRAILFVLTSSFFVMNQSRYRLFSLVIIVVIACAVLFFYLLKPAQAPVEEGVLPENPPAGVSVETLENGERLVRNEERGYTLQVADDWKISGSAEDLVIDSLTNNAPGSSGITGEGCRVVVVKTGISELENFAKQQCATNLDCSDYEIKNFNDEIQVLTFVGSFMGSGDKEFYLRPVTSSLGYDRLTFVCSDSTLQEMYQNSLLPTFRRGSQ
jgi:hypothetical protein